MFATSLFLLPEHDHSRVPAGAAPPLRRTPAPAEPGRDPHPRVRDGGELALLGTTMSPGFDGRDFELGRRDDLLRTHPGFRDTILALTCPG